MTKDRRIARLEKEREQKGKRNQPKSRPVGGKGRKKSVWSKRGRTTVVKTRNFGAKNHQELVEEVRGVFGQKRVLRQTRPEGIQEEIPTLTTKKIRKTKWGKKKARLEKNQRRHVQTFASCIIWGVPWFQGHKKEK